MLQYINVKSYFISSLIGKTGISSGGNGEVLSPEATKIKSKIDTLRADVMKEKEVLARNVGKAGDFNNEQYKNALDKITALEKEIDALQASPQVKNELAQLLGEVINEVKFDGIDVQKMGVITNKEFLSLPHEKRLPYITTGRVEYDKVANGTQKVIEFTFSFNGKINKDLYYKTTAGQVFPSEVSEVSIGGEIYFRTGLAGEFFTKNNKRLVIHDGTKVEVTKLRTQEEMTAIQQENANKVQAYLEQNPQANKEILKEAINRNIDPKFALLAFEDAYNAAKDGDKRYLLEDMVTEFERVRGMYGISGELENGKYNVKIALLILAEYNPSSWEDKAKIYGFTQEQIDNFKSKGERNLALADREIQNGDSLPDGDFLRGDKLLQNEAFSKRLDEVCASIGANRSDLIKIMKAESGLNSRVRNGIGATGLIQFTPETAEGLGTNVGELRGMTAVEQLDYVEKYFKQNSRGHALDSITKMYQVVFFPASLGKSKDWVFDAPRASAQKVALQNGGIAKFSTRSDGLIDGHCFERYVENHVSKFTA